MEKMRQTLKQQTSGYSVIEVVVLLFVFTTMFITMLTVFQTAIRQLNITRAKIVAVDVANEQLEIIRNLTYGAVGTVSGSPQGTLADTRTITRSNITFTISTIIKYVDDPFDGCVGEVPSEPTKSICADGTIVDKIRDIPANSNNPADYKKADVTVTWNSYYTDVPIRLSTIVAPKGLEGDTTKGFLLVNVFDANGVAVQGATVHIINSTLVPAYDKTFLTDSFGNVQLLDMEPAEDSYFIKVSKAGYSEDRTCTHDDGGSACTDSTGNPDPVKAHISISAGQAEKASFAIDRVSALNVNSYDESCNVKPNINFTIQGIKTISKEPSSILKNVFSFQTNGQGQWIKNDLEWDLYDLVVDTAGYNIAGVNHDLALNVLPNTNTTLNVLLANQTSNSLLITVKDNSGTSLSGATVNLTKPPFGETKLTGHGFATQSDWSGGSGQADYSDLTKYFSDDSHLDTASTTGQISLQRNAPSPFFTEEFETTTYRDAANTTADWNTDPVNYDLRLSTVAGQYQIGTTEYAQSLKLNSQHGKIVSATITATEERNDQAINYLLSADGGAHYESASLGTPLTFTDVGSDLRFRIEMSTTDEDVTPKVKNLTINYTIEYYDNSGELISSTINLGSAATFASINWEPASQPAETGTESVKFQIATSNELTPATWNFTGPDGTSATYYTTNNADINDIHNGQQYLRYKLILNTADIYYTPQISEIKISYTLACLPAGQVYFNNLESDTYSVEIKLAGYEVFTANIEISGYVSQSFQMTPIP